MPKEAIGLKLFLERIMNGEIAINKPLLVYLDDNSKEYFIFQDSGLNILLGQEGNGKTKFLTMVMIDLIKKMKYEVEKIDGIIYIDTERPESQYASTIKHIFDQCALTEDELTKILNFFSFSELNPVEIRDSITAFLASSLDKKYVFVFDHLLPLVNDFNKVGEANDIDLFFKKLIKDGNIIIASIHMPYSGLVKGLGHLGSSMQRLASFILEIKNSEDNTGFVVGQRKSRISAGSNNKLFLRKDSDGNITLDECLLINEAAGKKERADDSKVAIELLYTFLSLGLSQKKDLHTLIAQKKSWRQTSSGISTFYSDHLKELIVFGKDGYTLTDKGKSIIDEAETREQ